MEKPNFKIDPRHHLQEVELDDSALKLVVPFKALIVASSGFGKTTFIKQLLSKSSDIFQRQFHNSDAPISISLLN